MAGLSKPSIDKIIQPKITLLVTMVLGLSQHLYIAQRRSVSHASAWQDYSHADVIFHYYLSVCVYA
jgi:hypothetical protein